VVIRVALSVRSLGRPVLILLPAVVIPAVVCTLVTWWFLPEWWQLSAFFWYSIPGNSFVPLPHEPAVIYAGAIYHPALVAIVGGLATTVASTVDHIMFTRAFHLKRLAPIRETRVSGLAVRLFSWQPWWTVFIFAVTPIPFYPIRVIAPMANYSRIGYVSAVLAGRGPRYYLLALGGVWARNVTGL
jgi:membrane protein YqaA with SNARE-associated domain